MNVPLRKPNWAQRELLSHSPLFAGLAPKLLDELSRASRLLEVPAQSVLFEAGDPVREAYVLVSGTLKRSTILAGETKKVIELAQSQQLLGLGEAFSASRYASSGKTITPCIVVAIDIHKLRAIVRQDLDLSWRIIQAMAERQCAVEFDVTGYHYGLTGTQRLLDYLIELAGGHPGLAGETTVTLKTSKKIIAARIGMTPESLSRSLRLLSESGVIVVDGRNVHIQNAALLNTEVGNTKQRVNFSRKSKKAAAGLAKSLSPGVLINLCGRPRLLSQRMAAAWALIGQNISPAKAAVRLRQLHAQMERTLARLESLGLPGDLAEQLQAVQAIWPRYWAALSEVEPALEKASAVLELSEEILEAIDLLARQAAVHVALPAAHYVNIAGRNRMLSQRIGKLFLFREWGLSDEATLQRLGASCCEFESNLAELKRSGIGVPELAAQLSEVTEQWQKFESVLLPSLQHASKSRHALAALAEGERLLRHVDTTVKLYERLAK
ncbi:cyclic nucleotide-binding protein [Dechloromonas denitrificans]|uniref:Cyclic nucleotide-binding protein n=1 Tax=Dechloromonas denitrificans TaxID=281362 RepID=A0A133XKZ5_9RHOO|nr:type IV pili methyl-accepting chemotaxis transducer N-terminal domain-containing protein [Dechloromonas denitrificans]KXB31614.1 cyclic nucleotide-binding protein [Dechloromonas denitrificans]